MCARRRGLSILYVVVIVVALAGFVSMAVDIGRVRLARTQLQLATDAAARAGADLLPVSTQATIDSALAAADLNPVLDDNGNHGQRADTGVVLEPDGDLEFGVWDWSTREFTLLDDDDRRRANALHV